MADRALSIKIGADTTDVRTQLALSNVELRRWTAQLDDLAKQAIQVGPPIADFHQQMAYAAQQANRSTSAVAALESRMAELNATSKTTHLGAKSAKEAADAHEGVFG
jgi:hypothetical protein